MTYRNAALSLARADGYTPKDEAPDYIRRWPGLPDLLAISPVNGGVYGAASLGYYEARIRQVLEAVAAA